DRSRIPGDDARIEPADVDAELLRSRRRYPEQPSFGEVAFERAPLFGKVPGTVRSDAAGQVAAFVGEQIARVLCDELRALPRPRERDRANVLAREAGQQPGGLRPGAVADLCDRAVGERQERRVPEREELLFVRRSVVGDRVER